MNRRSFIKHTGAAGLLTLITPTGFVQAFHRKAATSLEQAFTNPPAEALPQTWWHWMNGNVTKEGITLDLEAMHRVGIGGVQNFDAGTGIPKGPVVYLSPEWLELKKHAIRECERLGLEFTMHNCPGWSSSGGPWITPELAMQQLTWSETRVKGGRKIKRHLPQPFTKLDYYRDVAVLAFPAPAGEAPLETLGMKATANGVAVNLKQLTGEDPLGLVLAPATAGQDGQLILVFDQPYEARGLSFIAQAVPAEHKGGGPANAVVLEVSEDGQQYKALATVSTGGGFNSSGAEASFFTAEFPAVKARYYRLSSAQGLKLSQVNLSGAGRLKDWKKKANYAFSGTETIPDQSGNAVAVPADSIQDISRFVDSTGQLTWKAPAGNWIILRLGFTPIGTLNRSAPDTGVGLECDKYNPEAMTFHFNKMMESLLPTLKPLADKGRVGLLIDSWEVGMQNWTAKFPEEFKNRNGYELLPYLPAMTGRVVGNADTTERFLWDLRRTQADMLADHYYGKLDALCNQHGMLSYTEPYDRGPMEEMQIGARVDVNMGEFWNGLSSLFQNNWTMRRTTKLAASIAHINGQKVVGAEAFTGEPESARWQEYPFAMKALGDKMFTQGLNRIIFHRYAHQPHPTALPGMTMGPWGIHFDRTTTWWEPGKAWLRYLARCQSMLQQGRFVADLAYFTGEEAGVYASVSPDELNPAPPTGYDYDLINAEVLLQQASVRDQHLVLRSGMRYRVLVLQQPRGMSLALLRKLHALVREGLVIVGAKPRHALGLREGAVAEAAFEELTGDLWGAGATAGTVANTFGQGHVFWGQTLSSILAGLNVKPDFQFSSASGDAPVTYIHRRTDDADIYFLANQRRQPERLVCTFRVAGKQPELWDPDSGTSTPLAVFELQGDTVRVPVNLDPAGSAFLVFRHAAPEHYLQAVIRDRETPLSVVPFRPVARPLFPEVSHNFTISFWAKPEINVMLSTRNFMDHIPNPWTDYYALYPAPGEKLYGPQHATCGLAVGRNGVAVWENSKGVPVFVLAAPAPLSGWSHVALVYEQGVPVVFVNGNLVARGTRSPHTVHPGIGQAFLAEGASYYNGDRTEPELVREALTQAGVKQLAVNRKMETPASRLVTAATGGKAGLLFWENGRYRLLDHAGKTSQLQIAGLAQPQPLSGAWRVSFPPERGAPAQITLPALRSLHLHDQEGVKHFSGTATYHKTFTWSPGQLPQKEGRVFLDLGRVEVLAAVRLNGQDLGILWKRPYRVDITEAVKAGANTLEVAVTNLWPNRLIGDAHLPDPDQFTPGAGASGFASLSNGAIEQLPEWYRAGRPKPANGRVTFTTWKHYNPDSPLLESGLIGPVMLQTAVEKHLG